MTKTRHGCCDIEDADLCPPDEQVVRTDLANDAETPPEYCESCPLADCAWEYAGVCLGLRKLRSRQGNAARAYYREMRRMYRGGVENHA